MRRPLDTFLAILLVAALALLATKLKRPAEELAGTARVIDGDTVELDGRRLRLSGLDAPELNQSCERDGKAYACGHVARDRLRTLGQAGLSCTVYGQDRFGRGLAVCLAAGQDVGRELVRSGLAVAYGRYEDEERHAAASHLGLWAGTFERPAEWRKAHPRVQ